VIADLFWLGIEARSVFNKFSFGSKKINQLLCIHALCATGVKAGISAKSLFNGGFQALTSKATFVLEHEMQHFVAVDGCGHVALLDNESQLQHNNQPVYLSQIKSYGVVRSFRVGLMPVSCRFEQGTPP